MENYMEKLLIFTKIITKYTCGCFVKKEQRER